MKLNIQHIQAGRNKKVIEQYIRNQREKDFSSDPISLTEYIAAFTGNKNMWAKKDSRTLAAA